MKINVLHLMEGSKKARGIAVIIDVFRAFSLECFLIQNHAKRILPLASKELAYELKAKNPDYVLIGERHGVMLPGFDFGNSPSQVEHVDFTNKTIVHTTSSGTQGLENAANAKEILTGSLVNAKAIADYIRARHSVQEVSLVCMGWEGIQRAEEDELCAEYIKALLENRVINMDAKIESLKHTGGKKFFDPAQKEIFPEQDFYLSTALDRFDFVLRYERDGEGIGCIRRINP